MNFDQLLARDLTNADVATRNEYYARAEAKLRDLIAQRAGGRSQEEEASLLQRFNAARDAFEARLHTEAAQARRPEAPAAASPEPSRATNRQASPVVLGAVLLAGVVIGYIASALWQSLDDQTPKIVTHFNEVRANYHRNLSHLRDLRARLEEFRRTSGAYPTAPEFVRITQTWSGIPMLAAAMAANAERSQKVLYKSDGKDYKLLYYMSGDCFVASVLNPQLIDAARQARPVDCTHYGFWTSAATNW